MNNNAEGYKCAQVLQTHNAQSDPVMWPWELHLSRRARGASSSEEEVTNQSTLAEKCNTNPLGIGTPGTSPHAEDSVTAGGPTLPQTCPSVCSQWEVHGCSGSPQTLQHSWSVWRHKSPNTDLWLKLGHLNIEGLSIVHQDWIHGCVLLEEYVDCCYKKNQEIVLNYLQTLFLSTT